MSLGQPIGRFVAANRAICDRIEKRLPESFTRSLAYAHTLTTAAEMSNRSAAARVLDIGGGHTSRFAGLLAERDRPTLIGLDVAESQISGNETIDFGIVGDACEGLPLKDGSIDIAVTHSLLEHLPDPRVTIVEIARVLRPNGVCIHVFPSRFSPFSVLNRLIPAKLGRRLLLAFFPEWAHTCGFPAFYRYCDATAMTRLHKEAGLDIRLLELRYYQSIYFKFFVPLFLIGLCYDYLLYILNFPLLACQVLMVAEKPYSHVQNVRAADAVVTERAAVPAA